MGIHIHYLLFWCLRNLRQSDGGTKGADWLEIFDTSRPAQGKDDGTMVRGQKEGGYVAPWKVLMRRQKRR